MASIKEFINQTLQNFSTSLSKIYVKKNNIVDNLTSTDTDKPLSANQGKVLKDSVDTLNSNFAVYTTSTGQKEEVTTEEFLNYLVDIGKLPKYTIVERKMLCEWSYANHKVLSDTPVKISLAGCFIELYGRYTGNLSGTDNNFIMRLTGSPAVMTAYHDSKNKVYVFRTVGGVSQWLELTS